jgi:hypothetical protein
MVRPFQPSSAGSVSTENQEEESKESVTEKDGGAEHDQDENDGELATIHALR